MIKRFNSLFAGHVDLGDMGENATPANASAETVGSKMCLSMVFLLAVITRAAAARSRTTNAHSGTTKCEFDIHLRFIRRLPARQAHR